MGYASFSPAVAAGLQGAMAMGLPFAERSALAEAVGAYGLAMVSADYLMGLATGISVCGVVAIAVGIVASRKSQAEREERELAAALSNTASQSTLSEEVLNVTGAEQADAVIGEDEVAAAQGAAEDGQELGEREVAAPKRRPAHMRIEAQDSTAADENSEPEDVLPAVQEEHEVAASHAGRHTASDYENIAENYVSRLSWRDRMGIRARGVQVMLAERLGVDLLEDVPVIQRADGSVGDVGTGWWDAKLGDSVKRDFSDIPEVDDIDMTGLRNALKARGPKHGTGVIRVAAVPARPAPAAPVVPDTYESRVANLNLSAADRSVFITNHVAAVDAFPEVGSGTGEDTDLWQLAMDAMDARGSDIVSLSGMSAPEDPLHMADTPTEVLPFRPVAGHPEVVDKTSYVDYLLRQELERNSSDAVRRTGRDYLRLIEGGSSKAATLFKIPKRDGARHARPARHMAPALDELPLAVGA